MDATTRQLSRAVERLNALVEASRKLSELVSTTELLDYFIRFTAETLEVERASLMLLDPTTQRLRIAAQRGLEIDVDVDDIEVRLGQGISGAVALTGEPYIVSGREADRRPPEERKVDLSDSFLSAPIRLSVPLKASSKVLGVVNLTNRKGGLGFDKDDLGYVQTLASHLAVALQKSRQFVALENANAALVTTREQLILSERLKATGQMAAGIAHDFNNNLSVILARAQFILSGVEKQPLDAERIRSNAEAICKTALVGAEIIKKLQDYSRVRRAVTSASVDLSQVVRDAIEITSPKWKQESEAQSRHVRVHTQLVEGAVVSGEASELTQVVGNLIFNALDAMPHGGELTFRTECADGRAVLTVSDTGVGITEAVRIKLFEPFFSTKPNGQGLGMSVAYAIVKRHGGTISARGQADQGATFRIELPLTALPLEPRRDAFRDEARRESYPATVLMCDDDDEVRDVYTQALAKGGHRVVAVPSGAEALDELQRLEFDLVITDLSMPGMSGLELTEKIRTRYGKLPVILLSGWAVEQEHEHVRDAGVDRVLLKPCTIENLLLAVEETTRASLIG